MNRLDLECLKYVSQDTLNNIEGNYKKIVVIEYNPDLINENKKNVGKVLGFINANNKVSLNGVVEFRIDKIKWVSSRSNDGNKMVLVDPYWVKSYFPDPKLKIPVKSFDPKTNTIITELADLTYSQFIKRELLYFYGKWDYHIVAAYENFYYLMKNNQYYYAINSTVKHYFISQEELQNAITRINNEKKRIKSTWNKFLSVYHEANEAAKTINSLFNKSNIQEKEHKVVPFSRKQV